MWNYVELGIVRFGCGLWFFVLLFLLLFGVCDFVIVLIELHIILMVCCLITFV